jgi:hypothetical protein
MRSNCQLPRQQAVAQINAQHRSGAPHPLEWGYAKRVWVYRAY